MRFLLLIPYVTLWPWPLTHWSLISVVRLGVMWTNSYQIWPRSIKLQMSYWLIYYSFFVIFRGCPKTTGFWKGHGPICTNFGGDTVRSSPYTKYKTGQTSHSVLERYPKGTHNLARVVCNSNRSTSAGPLLQSLHWLPVRQRINFKLAKLCYLVTSFKQPGYLADLIRSAHTVSLICCDHPHRSFCQLRRTTWTLLLVVSLLRLRDFGTLFHWTVKLPNPLTHLGSVLRHFSLIRHNCTVARASVLWRDINLLIDWLTAAQNWDSLSDKAKNGESLPNR